jgi:hypothetical protein
MAIELLTSFGMDILSGWADWSASREQGKISRETLEQQIALYNKQKKQLIEAYGQRDKLMTDVFGNEIRKTSRILEEQKAKTGLAFSGSAEEYGKFETDKLRSDIGQAKFQSRMEREKILSDIDITIKGLEGQKRQAEAMENEKFLGIF